MSRRINYKLLCGTDSILLVCSVINTDLSPLEILNEDVLVEVCAVFTPVLGFHCRFRDVDIIVIRLLLEMIKRLIPEHSGEIGGRFLIDLVARHIGCGCDYRDLRGSDCVVGEVVFAVLLELI